MDPVSSSTMDLKRQAISPSLLYRKKEKVWRRFTGRPTEREEKGSKVRERWPHTLHSTSLRSWPWKVSTMKLLAQWASE